MHPRISELLAYVHEQTAVLHSAFHAVPAERRGERPAPDRWSPAEIVHHVMLADRRVAHRLSGIADQVRPLPREDQVGPILPTIKTGPLLDRSQRLSAPEAIHPANTDAARVWGRLRGRPA